jgi:hypothetical protein
MSDHAFMTLAGIAAFVCVAIVAFIGSTVATLLG